MEISSAPSASVYSTVGPLVTAAGRDSGSTVNAPSNTVAPNTQTRERTAASAEEQAAAKQQAEQQELRELASRDREVRNHEQAHAAAGGAHAGSPQYEFTTGSNGVSYATGGHVNIDVSDVPGDAQATIDKMQTVQRAALAPAQPSAQDRAVASEASARATEARAELREENQKKADAAPSSPQISAYESAQSGQAGGPAIGNALDAVV
jgi:hypothetical protein